MLLEVCTLLLFQPSGPYRANRAVLADNELHCLPLLSIMIIAWTNERWHQNHMVTAAFRHVWVSDVNYGGHPGKKMWAETESELANKREHTPMPVREAGSACHGSPNLGLEFAAIIWE